MKVVKFLKGYESYSTRDTAGFADEVADALVAEGIAEVTHVILEPENKVKDEEFDLTKATPEIPETTCAICGKEHKTVKGLKAHLCKAHDVK